jgi:Tol biopolymer transport system component
MTRRSTVSALALGALLLCWGPEASAGKPGGGGGGGGGGGITNPAIAFAASPGPGKPHQIFLTTSTGSTTVQITNDGLNHRLPTWSPDGTRIAFLGNVPGTEVENHALYSVRADGSDRVLHFVLWGTTGFSGSSSDRISWSPDGTRIAYTGADNGLYVLTLSTGTAALLLPTISNARQWSPTWSPDGSRIALSRFDYGDGNNDLMVVDVASGTAAEILDDPSQDDGDPDWSKDGDWIVFRRGTSLHKIHPDGTGLTLLVAEGSVAPYYSPSWSPDGAYVCFSGWNAKGDVDVYRVRADGSGFTDVTNSRNRAEGTPAWNPAWTPDL